MSCSFVLLLLADAIHGHQAQEDEFLRWALGVYTRLSSLRRFGSALDSPSQSPARRYSESLQGSTGTPRLGSGAIAVAPSRCLAEGQYVAVGERTVRLLSLAVEYIGKGTGHLIF